MTQLAPAARFKRLADVRAAVADGRCYTDLAATWNLNVSPTWLWCHRNVSIEDRRVLASNGNRRCGMTGRASSASVAA